MANQQLSEKTKKDLDKIDQLILHGYDLMSFDIKQATTCAEDAQALSLESHYTLGLSSSLILLGSCENIGGDSSNAILHLQKGLNLAQENDLPDVLAKGYLALGNVYYKFGDLEDALTTYLKGVQETRRGSGDREIILLNNISVIYSKTNQLEQSLKILLETLRLAETETEFYGFVLANIAEVYFKMEKIPEVETYLSAAEVILSKEVLNLQYLIQLHKTKGKLASYQKQETEALASFNKALALSEQLGDHYRRCNVSLEIGRHYMTAHHYALAIETFKLTQQIATSIQADVELRDISLLLAQCYEQMGDYQNALTQVKRHNTLYQKINTKSLDNQLLIKTAMFEAEQAKKDAEIQRLRNEEVHLIGKIGQIITATLDIKMVLRLIYKHIQSIVEVDAFGVCTVNPENHTIEFKMMIEHGKKQPLHEVSINDPSSLAAKCVRDRQVIHLEDLTQSSLKSRSRGMSMRSIIFFPLIVSDEVIGVLTLQSQRPNAYSENALRLVDSLGAYIGIALKNSLQSEDLAKKTEALERLSQTDGLTNLYNRRFMMNRLEAEWAHYERTHQAFYIAMLDVDHFKQINDLSGHHVGDALLIKIGQLMKKNLRKYDVVGRWGGEEFLLFIPENDEAVAMLVCERLREAVEKMRLMHQKKRIPVTVTLGLTRVMSEDENIGTVIQRADTAMYEGKKKGRNCLVLKQ